MSVIIVARNLRGVQVVTINLNAVVFIERKCIITVEGQSKQEKIFFAASRLVSNESYQPVLVH